MNPYGEPDPENALDAWFALGVICGGFVVGVFWIVSIVF